MSKTIDCAICSQALADRDGDLLYSLIGNSNVYERFISLESESFFVIPSIGPLTIGHVLLCPKNHYPSFASLPHALDAEYKFIRQYLHEFMYEIFGKRIHSFEHGMDKTCTRTLCTVSHAHQHFLPSEVSILEELQREIDWIQVASDLPELRKVVGDNEYLIYSNNSNNQLVAPAHGVLVESQFIRKLFANALGKSTMWDWREFPFPETIKASFQAFEEKQIQDLTE